MKDNGFYTLRGYNLLENSLVSSAMEDYLEMIFRLLKDGKYVRVNQLALALNVKPPSSSKMVSKLKDCGFVEFESYGIIKLTKLGEELGGYLLHRHEVLQTLFCKINGTDRELELVEKIEHFFDERTVSNIEKMLKKE